MIDARETAPGIAPVVTTLPKPFPKDDYRLFDETREWRADDAFWAARYGLYAFQVRPPASVVFVTPTT